MNTVFHIISLYRGVEGNFLDPAVFEHADFDALGKKRLDFDPGPIYILYMRFVLPLLRYPLYPRFCPFPKLKRNS